MNKLRTGSGPRRTALEVAKRCLCMELVIERVAMDDPEAIPREEAAAMRDNTLEVATFLGLDATFMPAERRALRAAIGDVGDVETELSTIYADVPYLLWALGRIPRLVSVADLGPMLNDVVAAGLWNVGDRHEVKRALDSATLISDERIDAELSDIAKANALVVAANGDLSTVPPGSVFYVWPWLQFAQWTWGQMSAMELDLEGVMMRFGIDGVHPV